MGMRINSCGTNQALLLLLFCAKSACLVCFHCDGRNAVGLQFGISPQSPWTLFEAFAQVNGVFSIWFGVGLKFVFTHSCVLKVFKIAWQIHIHMQNVSGP